MTQSKNTKRALLTSMLSIVLCIAMLVGATFAWFTDSVTSGRNQIVAGTLDVELYHTNGFVTEEKKVDKDTKLFLDKEGKELAWEPGVVAYENFTVKNEGTLALTFRMSVNVNDFNTVTVNGQEKSLKDVLKVAVVKDGFNGDRTAAQALKTYQSLADFETAGTLPAAEDQNTATYGIVLYWEPGVNDNDYNLNNGQKPSSGDALFVDLGVTLVAAQAPVETDSFGSDYDQNAEYPMLETDDSWYVNNQTADRFIVKTAGQLAYLAQLVNGGTDFSGKTVSLANDVTIPAAEWAPIGIYKKPFRGTFDGQGHTVSSINIHDNNGDQPSGFFGAVENATIKGLKVSGVMTLDSQQAPIYGGSLPEEFGNGGICGYAKNSTIQRCTNDIDIDATQRKTEVSAVCVGGIVGFADNTQIENCLNEGNLQAKLATVGGITALTGYLPRSPVHGVFSTYGILNNCVNAGAVTLDDSVGPDEAACGSITGLYWGDDKDGKPLITKCYSVKGEQVIGLDVATVDGDKSKVEATHISSAIALTAFNGLSTDIWTMGSTGYPILK